MKSKSGPGKAYRKGMTFFDLMDMFPDEDTARAWFEGVVWGNERACGHCGSTRTSVVKSGKPMPYRCKDCRKHFSVEDGNRTGMFQLASTDVGACDLPVPDQPKER